MASLSLPAWELMAPTTGARTGPRRLLLLPPPPEPRPDHSGLSELLAVLVSLGDLFTLCILSLSSDTDDLWVITWWAKAGLQTDPYSPNAGQQIGTGDDHLDTFLRGNSE